jgi:hypothetical protein
MTEPGELDIATAWMRRAQGDLKAFIGAFAARMEGALPGRVTVDRKRDGLFSTKSHVAKVTLDTGSHLYILELANNRLAATRSQTIRGVRLKSEEMGVPEWLEALNADIRSLADHAGSAHDVLHDFLTS